MWFTVEPVPVEPDVPDPSVAVDPDTLGAAPPDVLFDGEPVVIVCVWAPSEPVVFPTRPATNAAPAAAADEPS